MQGRFKLETPPDEARRESPREVVPLENLNPDTGPGEIQGGRQSSKAGPDDHNFGYWIIGHQDSGFPGAGKKAV
jgi:hypothetical protein